MANSAITIGMTPSHPGAFVRDEIIEGHGLSIARAAELLHVRVATLSDLLNEKSSVSPEMALRVEKAFGLKMETLLKMQALYDAAKMRLRADTIAVTPYAR